MGAVPLISEEGSQSWKCRIASGASAEKATAASKVEMMFGVQAEPESGLISLVKMMKRSVALFVDV